MKRAIQTIWRLAPEKVRHSLGRRIEFTVRRGVLGKVPPRLNPPEPGALVVSHYGADAFGIGRAGQYSVQALRRAGFEVLEHDIRPALADRRNGAGQLPGAGGVWITHCNPEHAAALLCHIAREDWAGRYRIGYWAWELPRAPSFWVWMTRFFDEVWVPSSFVAEALSGSAAAIKIIPHVVTPAPRQARAPGPLRIVAMADLRSAEARKNPSGAIAAFKRAFPEATDAAVLRIKLHGVDFDPSALKRLRDAAEQRSDIEIITETLSDAEIGAFVAQADIFLALHRSEGFGLGIAEAMALGIPALATAWSGNMDYMHGLAPLLVSYRLTPVRDASGVYRARTLEWAEPDLGDAAVKLRALADDAGLRERLGLACQERIAELGSAWGAEALGAQDWRTWLRH